MRKKIGLCGKLIILACLVIAIYWIGGCSEKITNTSNNKSAAIHIKTELAASKLSALVTHGLLTVNARDLDSVLVGNLEYVDGFMVGEIIVPEGADRSFTIQVYDAANLLLYQGSTVADVLPDVVTELPIELRPARPMLSFTPHYGEVAMRDSFVVDINLFSIPNLGNITLDLVVSQTGPTFIEYTIKGITLCTNCDVWHEGHAIGAWSWSESVEARPSLTDINGDAQLARSIFRSHADWPFDTATVKITAVIQSMFNNTNQDTISVNSVYVDESEIFLIFNPVE